MCKGISLIATKENIYWDIRTNSHEDIKGLCNIKDNEFSQLLIVELYPRGEYFLSTDTKDWEINYENTQNWYEENRHETDDRIYTCLFSVIFPKIKEQGIKLLDLSNLSYKKLPKFDGVKIKYLYCYNNQLTKLEVPKGIETLNCSNNQLTKLEVPKGIEILYCFNNKEDFKSIKN